MATTEVTSQKVVALDIGYESWHPELFTIHEMILKKTDLPFIKLLVNK